MEKWLSKYGKFLNNSALEIELGIRGGTLTKAYLQEIEIPADYKIKIQEFVSRMHQDLVEQESENRTK